MGVSSHAWTLPPIVAPAHADGRPPYALAPSRRCELCSLFAVWLVPEVTRCFHHLPLPLIALANERREEWIEQGSEAWKLVLLHHPIRTTAADHACTG